MTADNHIHTRFSPDSQAEPEAMVQRAIAAGLRQITFTDHCDPGHPEGFFGLTGTTEYVRTLTALKRKYAGDIYVGIGLEIGYLAGFEAEARALSMAEGVEYVINSVHVCGGSDCYFAGHYDGLTREAAYKIYFDAVQESLGVPYPYHAVGHVSYVERKAPYQNAHITYAEWKETLDPIFDGMIEREKILELNTNAAPPLFSLPSPELAAAYYARGGRLVALSSDAHAPERVADRFAEAERILRDIGFRYVTTVRDGARTEYRL